MTSQVSQPGGLSVQTFAYYPPLFTTCLIARLHRNSRLAASRGARDRTKYGLSRASPRSYLTHHIQRIAFAAVRANAKHARWMISCFKTSVCAGA